MALKFIDEIDVAGKRVLARFDFNVPLDKDQNILDTSRVDLAIPTIKYLIEGGASKIIMMSHLGRPKGEVKKEFSLEPVATYLAEKLEKEVILSNKAIDNGIKSLLHLNETKIVLLENLRFNPEETSNDMTFAGKLAEYGEIYINDAFGAAHRKHASVYAINQFFKGNAFGGFLLKSEIQALTKILDNPPRPFVSIIGGAKVSDKIKTIEKLLISVDKLLIGGAMAYPFLKAKGFEVGTSLCSDEDVALAKSILKKDRSNKIELPCDHNCSDSFSGEPTKVAEVEIPNILMGLDIGEQTVGSYSNIIHGAKTVLWNGPMGIFENSNYNQGTFAIARACADSEAYTLVGGGDSVSAVKKSGLADKFSHVSSGGGASLEFIEKGELPGIQVLKFGVM
jgi:phosphoglycerate kinase